MRILIADDHELLRDVLRSYLEAEGGFAARRVTLLATGSEVALALSARRQLQSEGIAIETAKSSSAELLRLRTQQLVSQAQIDMAEAAVYPTLALAHRRALGSSDNGTDPSRTYLALQFSPGPGLSARSAVAAARSRLENSMQNAVVYERQLEQQVRTALADLEALTQQVEPAQQLVSATEEVVASYLRQYQIGKKKLFVSV